MRDFTHIDENNLINNGFIILDYDENLNELLLSYDTNTFKNIHLPLSSWKCKIKKLKQGKLFEILMKYEKLAFKLYEDILKIDLEPGDMLIYSGCELEHWREEFKGKDCGQVFLHYNDAKKKTAKANKFDTRPFLGLPAFYKGFKSN